MFTRKHRFRLAAAAFFAMGAITVGCSGKTNEIVAPTTSGEVGGAVAPPAPTALVATQRYILNNGRQALLASPRLAAVAGYEATVDVISVAGIRNNTDDDMQWDVSGNSAVVQLGNSGGSVAFDHTLVRLPAGSIVEHRSMALRSQESDIRTWDIPPGYRGWVLVSAGRSYVTADADDLAFSSTTGRIGRTLIALAATAWGNSRSVVVCDVYFVAVPEASSFDLVAEQPLVMYNGTTATVPAPPASFGLWQEYTTSQGELSSAILSSELQKKIREVVPDNFAMAGTPGDRVDSSDVTVTPAQIGQIVSWGKQLWDLGVLVFKFFSSDPRDNDVSFHITRSPTAWIGTGVDGNSHSRAVMQVIRVRTASE